MFVRLKPLAPDYGVVKNRFHVGGKLFIGGTGMPGDIPVWYRVNANQAEYLKRYKQDDNDFRSPPAFDIVANNAERQAIDDQEEMERKMALGLIPKQQRRLTTGRTTDISTIEKDTPVRLDDMATGRRAALDDLEAPAPPVDEGPAMEINTTSDDDGEGTDRDFMDNQAANRETNREARADVPDMSAAADVTPAEAAPEVAIAADGLPPVTNLPTLAKDASAKPAKKAKKGKSPK